MSCNGCRVLRKACGNDCILRPCLEWIRSPESQANATLFLAKFYGRAGLINLINSSGPTHLHPEIFRSLLYEACGRIINPVYGSVGLMSSGNWSRCHAAVEAVLRGTPLMIRISGDEDSATAAAIMPNIRRRMYKNSTASLHRVMAPNRFKRHFNGRINSGLMNGSEAKFTITGWVSGDDRMNFSDRAPTHDSLSVETVEPAPVNMAHRVKPKAQLDHELELELTLG